MSTIFQKDSFEVWFPLAASVVIMLQQKLILLILLITYFHKGFAYEYDYGDYYEESKEWEELMCDSDNDCPKHLPKCNDNHCQWECENKDDCMGCECVDHK